MCWRVLMSVAKLRLQMVIILLRCMYVCAWWLSQWALLGAADRHQLKMPPKMSAAKKKVIGRIMDQVHALTVSGAVQDLEVPKTHFADVLATKLASDSVAISQQLKELDRRIHALVPGTPDVQVITHVLPPTHDQSVTRFWAAPWQFGADESCSLKGKSSMSAIFEIAQGFLEKPYQSETFPVAVLMPFGAPAGSPVGDFTLVHSCGFGRTLAVKMVMLAILRGGIQDAELAAISAELVAMSRVECVYAPKGSLADEITESLLTKMRAAERQRPFPTQILVAFRARCQAEGRPLAELPAAINEYFQEVNSSTAVQGNKFFPHEVTIVKFLAGLDNETFALLESHWGAYRVQDSALPLTKLAALVEAVNSETAMGAPGSAGGGAESDDVYRQMFRASPAKWNACLTRHIGIFLYKIKMAVRMLLAQLQSRGYKRS